MQNALLVTMLFLGASACAIDEGDELAKQERQSESERAVPSELGKGESDGPTIQRPIRRQCGANDVSLRGGSPSGPTIDHIYMNEVVEVWSTDGVWHYVWYFAGEKWGYTLAQYYCPVF